MPNSLKQQRNGSDLRATDLAPHPGDFPVGSMKSRAAARAKLQRTRELSPYDSDCLLIHCLIDAVNYSHSPNSRDLVHTDVYKRGWEVSNARNPIVPAHLDPFSKYEKLFKRCRKAYLHFHVLHRKIPISGDVLRLEEIEAIWSIEGQEELIAASRAAWARLLPQFPCPVKFEQGKSWLRLAGSTKGNESWERDNLSSTAPEIWGLIEGEVVGEESSQTKSAISAVTFREDDAGDFYIEPFQSS